MRNKRSLLSCLLATVACAITLQSNAAVVTVGRVNGTFSGSGGEFNIVGLGNADYSLSAQFNGGFQSFCLENDEFVNPNGTTPYWAEISTGAIEGGSGGPNPDIVSVGTAWLYSQFAKGALTDYTYTLGGTRNADAAKLQNAIWLLEQETGVATPAPLANEFYDAVLANFGSLGAAQADYAGSNVKVVNLYTAVLGTDGIYRKGTFAQDQTIYVPAPAGTSLASLGVLALGFLARRRMKA